MQREAVPTSNILSNIRTDSFILGHLHDAMLRMDRVISRYILVKYNFNFQKSLIFQYLITY